MPTYKIRGIHVDFPFEAYDCQLVYMEKVIQSLQDRCNALLESPTGTGKTLCLLCATLAWRKSLGDFSTSRNGRRGYAGSEHLGESSSQSESSNLPSIIYTSRTHSQLRQVIQELKRTNYRPKMVVLGSREQLCIHEEVSLLRGRTQTNACHSLCRKRKKRYCAHYPRVAEFMKKNPGLGDEPIDIEELVNIGRSCGPCPYYVSRELHKDADILFAPYNYLIDRGNRKSLTIGWNNSILIFDEAHNLESLCADAASFDLSSGLLNACISEAKNCMDLSIGRREKSNDQSSKPDNFAILRALLLKLEKRIAEVPIESKEFGFTKPGPYIYELLADLNITDKTATMLIDIIEEATLLLEEDLSATDSGVPDKTKICRLESMGDILKIIFKDDDTAHAKYYRVHIQEVEASATAVFNGKASRTLSWWCFNPGLAMEEFSRLGVGSIILTSGTLSPMDSFAQEFKLEFPVRLENPHVISANQIWAGVVPAGPSGFSFNSSYRNRDTLEYKLELGNAIVNFARIIPDGLLVFFPSYYLLDQCIGCWKNMSHANSTNSSTIWERICKHKQPVVEPRQSSLFPLSIEDYMTKLKDTSTSGAVFFAVCRGKVSEGLDFPDHAGRAVVITGLPFATRTDPKVRLKREYMDQHIQSQQMGCKVLTGEEWYSQQASRAVNQAVGRVIRHLHDYGAIIFCDERFEHPNRQSQISLWIRPHIKCYSKFGDVVFTLTRFFRDEGIRGPTKLELVGAEDQGNVNRLRSAQPLEKLHLEKFLAPLTTPVDPNRSDKLSSAYVVKQGNISGQLGNILPANRSSLTSYKQNQNSTLRCSNDLLCSEKKMLITGKRSMQYNNCKIVDLTSDSTLDEKPSKELILPCCKKPKGLKIEPDLTQQFENYHKHPSIANKAIQICPSLVTDTVRHEKSRVSDNSTLQNAQIASAELLDYEMNVHKKTTESLSQKNKGIQSSSVPSGDEERRGSAFLIQVQGKLTDAEYKEFVGFMKALRSKAMKIGHVLQSIARLFSSPDRLYLFQRFKDYIPAKYHSLYEQYLKTIEDAADVNHKSLERLNNSETNSPDTPKGSSTCG
ncbi:regulator of telomere elongation helicase 1 homolog [Cornus florida]|uniref:regulator of telomere elongation helicase 1 homolog n=1 Tax=Cornus florida TaxID=4283 RepID=UPI00289A8323|nr:regulator of telomere elongation helicase 1 homolog [Cornus florida]XP_059642021.1 regulator of telomere elongation helicase 1 homolog [Cornus florida]